MVLDWSHYVQSFFGLLAIVNPFGAIPTYLALTERTAGSERRRILTAMAVSMLVVLLGALLAGNTLMHFFGIGLPTFRMAGGILLLTVAFPMLRGAVPESDGAPEDPRVLGVIPLGIPLLGGPGAISTVVVFSQESHGWPGYLLFVVAIVVVIACTYVSLRLAPVLLTLLGRTGLTVMTRIMGLLLVAMALEFIAAGLGDLFPGLLD